MGSVAVWAQQAVWCPKGRGAPAGRVHLHGTYVNGTVLWDADVDPLGVQWGHGHGATRKQLSAATLVLRASVRRVRE
jgi:hypothetical protein